jgi:hypothetical protein
MFKPGESLCMKLDGRNGTYRIVGVDRRLDRFIVRVTDKNNAEIMRSCVSDLEGVMSVHSSESVGLSVDDVLDGLLTLRRKLDMWSPELQKEIHAMAMRMLALSKEEPWLNHDKEQTQ